MKICVAGIGGVGGFIAAMLNRKGPDQLTLLARGKRKEHLLQNGLTVHSEMHGELKSGAFRKVTDGSDETEVQDLIFVCVKNYSLEEVCGQLQPMVGAETILVPVMNGVEAGNVLRGRFPEAAVADGLIYCNISAEPDFSVEQRGSYVRVFIGSRTKDARHEEAAKKAVQILLDAEIECHYSADIEAAIWKKYILNCAYNTTTARFGMTSGELRQDEDKIRDFEQLLQEAYDVAVKAGVAVANTVVAEHKILLMQKQPENATSSLKGDLWAGRTIELDAFTGALIRKAEEVGVDVPKTREYHEAIMKLYREIQAGQDKRED
ncbi:MAG: 2-dehydropantoate 2-reductase [Lachnospiraceae bacterium]|nr:2-dehydropantoate 2-reductase [Lachnospiraceae bacterium]